MDTEFVQKMSFLVGLFEENARLLQWLVLSLFFVSFFPEIFEFYQRVPFEFFEVVGL